MQELATGDDEMKKFSEVREAISSLQMNKQGQDRYFFPTLRKMVHWLPVILNCWILASALSMIFMPDNSAFIAATSMRVYPLLQRSTKTVSLNQGDLTNLPALSPLQSQNFMTWSFRNEFVMLLTSLGSMVLPITSRSSSCWPIRLNSPITCPKYERNGHSIHHELYEYLAVPGEGWGSVQPEFLILIETSSLCFSVSVKMLPCISSAGPSSDPFCSP